MRIRSFRSPTRSGARPRRRVLRPSLRRRSARRQRLHAVRRRRRPGARGRRRRPDHPAARARHGTRVPRPARLRRPDRSRPDGRAWWTLADEWRPDLLVCDEADYGCMVGAERLRLPHATVLTNASGSFLRAVDVAEPLDAIRAEHGLPPDPELVMPARDLVVSPFPPSFRDPAFPLPENAISIRPDPGRTLPGPAPDWLSHLPDKPTVYFTLGTIFNQESGDLFVRVLSGLRELPATVDRHRRTEPRSGTVRPAARQRACRAVHPADVAAPPLRSRRQPRRVRQRDRRARARSSAGRAPDGRRPAPERPAMRAARRRRRAGRRSRHAAIRSETRRPRS